MIYNVVVAKATAAASSVWFYFLTSQQFYKTFHVTLIVSHAWRIFMNSFRGLLTRHVNVSLINLLVMWILLVSSMGHFKDKQGNLLHMFWCTMRMTKYCCANNYIRSLTKENCLNKRLNALRRRSLIKYT